MMIAFVLSMPNSPSWDGKWSGQNRLHAVVETFSDSKANKAKVEEILEGSPYIHRWSDGWTASVSAIQVDAKEARTIRKNSAGFAGYNWMIDTIRRYGRILDSQGVKDFIRAEEDAEDAADIREYYRQPTADEVAEAMVNAGVIKRVKQ